MRRALLVIFSGLILSCGFATGGFQGAPGGCTTDCTFTGTTTVASPLTMSTTGATNSITSATNDATTSSTVAAITLAPTVNITNTDLVLEVNDSAGNPLLNLVENGNFSVVGDATVAGGALALEDGSATNSITSGAPDGVTSGSVAALTIAATQDITASDLLLEVNDSAGNQALGLTEAGALTCAGAITNGTITMTGNSLTVTNNTMNLTAISSGGISINAGGATGFSITSTDAKSGSAHYLQATKESGGAPSANDCDESSEQGRMVVDTTNDRLYVCNVASSRGWDFIALTDS